MLLIAKMIDAFSWEAFFLANDNQLRDDLMQLQVLLSEKNAEVYFMYDLTYFGA